MAFLVPDEGEKRFLEILKQEGASMRMYLYSNNKTPAHADELADYTAAADVNSTSLPAQNWSTPDTDGSGKGVMSWTADIITFSLTTAGTRTVYGYFVRHDHATLGTKLLWSERFSNGPYTLTDTADQVRITTLTLRIHNTTTL